MESYIRVLVNSSKNADQLKSGEIKFRKGTPKKPVWKLLVADEKNNVLYAKVFAEKPSSLTIENIVTGLAPDLEPPCNFIVPNTVNKMAPGLVGKLMALGFNLYSPTHGFSAGAHIGKGLENALYSLNYQLNSLREAMASCAEISVATEHPLGVLELPLSGRYQHSKGDRFYTIGELACRITLNRGRDPEAGRKLHDEEPYGAPVNRGDKVPPPQDVLDTILADTDIDDDGYSLTEYGEILREMALLVDLVRVEKDGPRHDTAMTALGTYLARTGIQLALKKQPALGFGEFSRAWFEIARNTSYQNILQRALINTLNNPVSLSQEESSYDYYLIGAEVDVFSPPGSPKLAALPNHHKLEKILADYFRGPAVSAIVPYLKSLPAKVYCWDSLPKLEKHYYQNRISSRSQFSPANSFTKGSLASEEHQTHLVSAWVVATSGERQTGFLSATMAKQMTIRINETLGKLDHGVTCRVKPWKYWCHYAIPDSF